MSRPEMLEPAAAYALWAENYPPWAHNPVMQAEQRAMLSLLRTDLDGACVLDAGCGSGRYLLHALRRGAARVTGVDFSPEMLARAAQALRASGFGREIELVQGDIARLPVPDAFADVTICALAVGHLETLQPALSELRRATRAGGVVLCSDVHPTGHSLGWLRDFMAGGRHYAVRHTPHSHSGWLTACAESGLQIERVLEPMLDPADIPAGAHFDPVALEIPVALVFRLRCVS
ncbi:MAG TPA: class I SAM-dependent methyltransferase [Rhodanobacteraceae bacterium]|nr:class I SAM-dependent methyltransferase [Rhodanobacteraceae bacterium]